MSDFASIVERTRRAFASVAKLEQALARDPTSTILQVNLAATKKLAMKSQEQLLRLSEYARVEVCNYRLIQAIHRAFGVAAVSRSLLEYQNLFTQIYDAKKNGPKQRAIFGGEAQEESLLELAYTYSGSLGTVLLARSERNLFEGSLDSSMQTLLDVTEIATRDEVKSVAEELGNGVVKRIHDWSHANASAGFSADVLWKKSDGKQIGHVVECKKMEDIVGLIEATSDEKTEVVDATGILVGGDLGGTFHFVVPNGPDFRGSLDENFDISTEMTLGRRYDAKIREKITIVYATEKVNISHQLISLRTPNEKVLIEDKK